MLDLKTDYSMSYNSTLYKSTGDLKPIIKKYARTIEKLAKKKNKTTIHLVTATTSGCSLGAMIMYEIKKDFCVYHSVLTNKAWSFRNKENSQFVFKGPDINDKSYIVMVDEYIDSGKTFVKILEYLKYIPDIFFVFEWAECRSNELINYCAKKKIDILKRLVLFNAYNQQHIKYEIERKKIF